ncbi:MAG: hypothetical protein K2N04_04075 [Alistipes sp.]|nr:hypothetical protein [Alistipes sp.]
MKKVFTVLVAAVALPGFVSAQVGKQVEVTKAYVPSLESAAKLPVQPVMTDTVKMYPEFEYAITPLPIGMELQIRPIRPATVTYWEFNRPRTCYLKAGAGYPLNSVVDFYASTQHPGTGYVVGYLNHQGKYADVRNTFGQKINSIRMHNRAGVALGKYFGRRVLEGGLSYDNRLYHRYGAARPKAPLGSGGAAPGSLVDYGDANLDLRFGDDFQNMERFNFEIAVHGGAFFDHSDVAQRAWQSRLGADARIGRAFGRHHFTLQAGYEWTDGHKTLFDYEQQQIRAGARYGFDGDLLRFVVGADYCHDKVLGEDCKNYVVPFARLDFDLGNRRFMPFVEVDGAVRDNGFRSLSLLNPYVVSGSRLAKSSVDYNFRLGLGGTVWRDRFDYRVYAAFSIRDNHVYWYGIPYAAPQAGLFSGVMAPAQARQTVASINGEAVYRPISGLRIDLDVHGYLYNDEAVRLYDRKVKLKGGEPHFRGRAGIRYEGRKIVCGVSARAESVWRWSMPVLQQDALLAEEFRVPFAIDLGVDFEWRISGRVSVFAEGRNLLDRRLYDYPWYPDFRVACTVGAKVVF